MVVLTIALILVAIIAISAFGLVLILARRLRSVAERVNLFLPASAGTLPHPGTPVAEFQTTSTDGQPLSRADLIGVERVVAILSTGCGDCSEEVVAFRQHASRLELPPIVGITGPAEQRAPMVAQLAGHAIVLEEEDLGPVQTALEISEFPAVLLVRDGIIQQADHRLAPILEALAVPSAAGSVR